jgi:hypothetical protein
VFERVLVSVFSLELVFFFSSIISYVYSYYNTTILCLHYNLYLLLVGNILLLFNIVVERKYNC